jgi:enamine deaminase RidA (YjgF/YER057c/UK114 family)
MNNILIFFSGLFSSLIIFLVFSFIKAFFHKTEGCFGEPISDQARKELDNFDKLLKLYLKGILEQEYTTPIISLKKLLKDDKRRMRHTYYVIKEIESKIKKKTFRGFSKSLNKINKNNEFISNEIGQELTGLDCFKIFKNLPNEIQYEIKEETKKIKEKL